MYIILAETETKEFYVSILLDRALGKNTVVYSTEGGMDIEHSRSYSSFNSQK